MITSPTGGRWYLSWNGVDSYAEHTHAVWTPSGYGDKIEFSFVCNSPGNGHQTIVADNDDTNFYMRIQDVSARLQIRYESLGGGDSWLSTPYGIIAGERIAGYVEFKASGVTLHVNGTSTNNSVVPDVLNATHVLNRIASRGDWNFDGTIHYLKYTNATPLQNVRAVQGDGVDQYVEIPAIVLTGDFDVSVWWRRADRTGTSFTHLLGGGAIDERLTVYDTLNGGTPNEVRVRFDGANINATTGAENIAIGQDALYRVTRTGGDAVSLSVDGDEKETGTISGDFTIASFGEVNEVGQNAGILWDATIVDKTIAVETDGVELVTNGDFADGLTNWTARNATLTVEQFDGKSVLKIADDGSYSQAYQSFSTEVGEYYRISLLAARQPSAAAVLGVDVYNSDGAPPANAGTNVYVDYDESLFRTQS